MAAKKKKLQAVCVEDKTVQLKSKMPQLKLKAGDFSPKLVACWGEGERVPFMFLCLAFDMISKETGRILITDIVCNMLRTVMHTTPDDLVPVVYLSANRIAPGHEGLELGIGDASIIKALAEACGRTDVQVKKQYKVPVYVVSCLFIASFWLSNSLLSLTLDYELFHLYLVADMIKRVGMRFELLMRHGLRFSVCLVSEKVKTSAWFRI
jgi:hypothetical protein